MPPKLVRLVELENGDPVPMRAHLVARPDYGRARPGWHPVKGGSECIETAVFSNLALAENDSDLACSFILEKGHPAFFVLDHAENRQAPDLPEVPRWLEITRAFWHEWNLFNYYRGPHQDGVRRSAITLKLLTYAPTGAIIAAPTTSLPEIIGGEYNWDYRFTWVRDTALLINTLFRLGYSGEAKAFYEFLAEEHRKRCEEHGDHQLPVLLPIREGTAIEEEKLDHLAGYRGSLPVRRGNRAANQLQFDNQGHFLQSLHFWKHVGGRIDQTKRDMAEHAIDFLRRHWGEPDNGIWEPLERSHHTYAKISACTAFERGRDLRLLSKAETDIICQKILRQVLDRGIREREGRKYLADHYETDATDATALLPFPLGFLPRELAHSTRQEVERQLGDGPWMYRTKGLREMGEGAFLLCGFWRIGHLIREGELDRAEALLEENIAAASPLGLYSEEIDPVSGNLLGNFPQGFSHLGLITTILDLQKAKEYPKFVRLPDHEKFKADVGRSIGPRAVLAGFFRVPRTLRLLTCRRSKWRRLA